MVVLTTVVKYISDHDDRGLCTGSEGYGFSGRKREPSHQYIFSSNFPKFSLFDLLFIFNYITHFFYFQTNKREPLKNNFFLW